jgi:hypothetical protein
MLLLGKGIGSIEEWCSIVLLQHRGVQQAKQFTRSHPIK